MNSTLEQRYPLLVDQLDVLQNAPTRDLIQMHKEFVSNLIALNEELTKRALYYREQVLLMTNGSTILKLDGYYQNNYPADPKAYCEFWHNMYRTTLRLFTTKKIS